MAKVAKLEKVAKEGEPLCQVAAVPIRRREGRLEVCLVTTRDTRRWTVPKGWRMKGRKDWAAAAIEAKQEAGLIGSVTKKPLGEYGSWKRLDTCFVLVRTKAYKLDVSGELASFRERGQRTIRWCSLADASVVVDEPGLAALLEDLTRRTG